MNTTEFLTITSAIAPDRLAMVFEDKRISYEELQNRANRLANALEALGVESTRLAEEALRRRERVAALDQDVDSTTRM